MALAHLTDEQTRTWTREQKDRWWFENVWRGDLPQLTIRSGLTGFLLGGILSATNLYIGGKTGVTLGVGLTSVILAFAMFRALSRAGLGKDFTILENNAMQSIATAAGYMTMPLVSSLAAYMMITNTIVPWWQMAVWMSVMSLVGVLVAFPLKRRFINEDQLPFPEGRACGVVLDALYHGAAGEGVFKAKLLGIAAGVTALYQLLVSDGLMRLVQFGRAEAWHLQERLDHYYYVLAAQYELWIPRILGTEFRTLGLRLTLDAAMFGVGGLMGIRIATSVVIGTIVNFMVLAPIMIARGDIAPRPGPTGELMPLNRAEIVNQWSLWWGVSMMVVGSLIALAGKPEIFTSVFKNLSGKRKAKQPGEDVLKHIELPLWISYVGVPVFSLLGCWLTHIFFGVPLWLAMLSLPLIFVLTVICVNSMALTSWTPTSSLSKITQFTIGAIDRANPASNLITGGMTAEVASNAANLLSDIKPGYMLGAKPRQQAMGHIIGIFSGALASTPLFFILFMPPDAAGLRSPMTIASDQFPMPSALQWRGVAELIQRGVATLPASAIYSMIGAAVVAAFIEIMTIIRKRPFPLSSVSIGLGVILPPEYCFTMFFGALFFWWQSRRHAVGTKGHRTWVEGMEPICAGLITGAALVGIGNALTNALLFAGG
ncbi:MAG: OPT/YSL family transporter [Chthoniobacterales bacterium]|nr:OPT/YSL family transporter [Chthoniobacterales bacterium]